MKTYSHLDKVIWNLENFEKHSLIHVCDSKLNFRFVGSYFANYLKLRVSDIIGNKLDQLNSPLFAIADKINNIYTSIIENPGKREYITGVENDKNVIFYHNEIQPIIESDNKIVGFYTKSKLLNNTVNLAIIDNVLSADNFTGFPFIYEINTNDYQNTISLSERESLVLHLVLYGMTETEISNIINDTYNKTITKSAVSKYIRRNLYTKFGVNSRSQLIINALKNNQVINTPKIMAHNWHKIH